MLLLIKRYDRDLIRQLAQQNMLVVFGDNEAGTGFGGQAAEARGEPNAVGIPTKKYPGTKPGDYWTDADFERVKPLIDAPMKGLAAHLKDGGHVVWPEDGVGSGRAELAMRAPRIYAYIERCFERLVEIGNGKVANAA